MPSDKLRNLVCRTARLQNSWDTFRYTSPTDFPKQIAPPKTIRVAAELKDFAHSSWFFISEQYLIMPFRQTLKGLDLWNLDTKLEMSPRTVGSYQLREGSRLVFMCSDNTSDKSLYCVFLTKMDEE